MSLIYHSGGAAWIFRLFTAITLPTIFILHQYGELPWVKGLLAFVVLPVALFAAVRWRSSEYIEMAREEIDDE